MNLYEYSEKNNREMGILFEKHEFDFSGETTVFKEALEEIREIINGTEIEKNSRETEREGFALEIIKNEKELTEELCKEINKAFGHKKFEAEQKRDKIWYCVCNNYFDKINLTITNRADLELKMDKERVENIFRSFSANYNEYIIEGFKIYWNAPDQDVMVYIDKRKLKYEISPQEKYEILREGANKMIAHLRTFF